MTAEEIWVKHFNGLHYDDITPEKEQKYAIEFAKLKCQELLEIVAEKALVQERSAYLELTPCKSINKGLTVVKVNKESIFNAVDLDEFVK